MVNPLDYFPTELNLWTKEGTDMKKYYACVKCGNTQDFRISIHNNWSTPVGSPGFFDDPLQHVASRDYVLKCLICEYEITIQKDTRKEREG